MMTEYRKYKDSGIPWIGEIPQDWELIKAKNIFSLRKSKGNSDDILLAATQKYGMIPQYLVEGVVQVKSDTDFNTFKAVCVNDFVISLRSFQGGFEMSDYKGVCSPAYQVFFNKVDISHIFYKYLFKSYGFISQINAFTIGIREGKNIQYLDFSMMHLPFPKVMKQQAIADFLDVKCGEVDELIALQEKMIDELKVYKQSVITEAVTKGLNPDAPLKDSGIEWIGKIPKEWEVLRIKNIFNLVTGTTPSNFEINNNDESQINWFTPVDINDIGCDLFDSQRKLSAKVIKDNNIKLFPVNSLIYVGIGATAGKVGYSHVESYSNQQITAFLSKGKNCNKFYFYYLLVNNKRIRNNAFYTTLPILNNSYLNQEVTIKPPLSEQQQIADYLDMKCAEIDEMTSIKQQKIEQLKEYKKSIIYEYVTGKKRVKI